MTEETKDSHFQKINDFDSVLGDMAGQILDKSMTPEINEQLVDLLLTMYKDEYHENPGAFVEIGAFSSDPQLREMWYMLPAKTRTYIEKKWGAPKMTIAKDVMSLLHRLNKTNVLCEVWQKHDSYWNSPNLCIQRPFLS